MVIDIKDLKSAGPEGSSDASGPFSDHKENVPNSSSRTQDLVQSMIRLDCHPSDGTREMNALYGRGMGHDAVYEYAGEENGKCSRVRDRISAYESLGSHPREVVHRRSIHEHLASTERSFNFRDLVSAFHAIEQKAPLDSVSCILKKFKTNDERPGCAKSEDETTIGLETGCFPKIANNPFFKRDNDAALRGTDAPARRTSLRNARRHRKVALDGESSSKE